MASADPLADLLPVDPLRLGLGCSRLGSVGGASRDEARSLLHKALEEGVRFFDTSNIYGQGDSERLLGEVLKGREDCIVATKAGKYVAWRRRALVPFKGAIRATVRRSSTAAQGVTLARSKPMPTRWEPSFLTRSLEGSLKRLGAEHVQIFMLHSPPAAVIADGRAVGALESARQAGKVGLVGVSVDDVQTATACLGDSRISVLQVPLRPDDDGYGDLLNLARQAGVAIVAREILGGMATVAKQPDPLAFARERIRAVTGDPTVAIALVGITKVPNLVAATAAARATDTYGS